MDAGVLERPTSTGRETGDPLTGRAATPPRLTPAVPIYVDPKDGVELVTIPGAAELTGVKPRAVYRWIQSGRIETRRLAGSRRLRVVLSSLWTPA